MRCTFWFIVINIISYFLVNFYSTISLTKLTLWFPWWILYPLFMCRSVQTTFYNTRFVVMNWYSLFYSWNVFVSQGIFKRWHCSLGNQLCTPMVWNLSFFRVSWWCFYSPVFSFACTLLLFSLNFNIFL